MASCEIEPTPSASDLELLRLRFDYAWKWFSFHADQRVKMFNYMLLAFGIFATAIVGTVGKDLGKTPSVLCFLAAALAFIFWRIDSRNRDLVWLGEDVLIELEMKNLFGQGTSITDRNNKRIPYGLLSRGGTPNAPVSDPWWRSAWLGKHRFWNPAIAILIGLLFLVAGIWFWCAPPPSSPP